MYELTIEDYFAAAHQLRNYNGKCERLHGHNWKVQVSIISNKLNDIGICMDFKDLKKITREVLDNLEHTFLNELFPFTEINPSSENIAKWIYENIKKKIEDIEDVQMAGVTVWESDTASATYYE